jgi:hypothetical protein
MNNFEDVYGLNRDDRQMSNLETYRRFISKGDKPLDCIKDEDAKAIKDVLSGKGKLLAVVDGRRSMAGNHKYVLFVKEEGGVKVYLYTVLNGLYNEMGPYKDLDTAMSNADCYGLFEECKQIANKKVLNESTEDEEEFEDWDSEGFDDVCEGDMEDFSWDSDDPYAFDGRPCPHSEREDFLADCFPTRNPEYQDDDGEYDPFNFTQLGDSRASFGERTPEMAYADNFRNGDNAVAYDTDEGVGMPIGGTDLDDPDDTDTKFAMFDDADLDAWANE